MIHQIMMINGVNVVRAIEIRGRSVCFSYLNRCFFLPMLITRTHAKERLTL